MNTSPDMLLEVRDVDLRFNYHVILEKINFNVKIHEILVIMGLSGCGKSTLLRLIMGLLKADGGSLLFKEQDITQLSRPQLNDVRGRIGMVYQKAALISSMSVRQNISLPLQELTTKKPREIDEIVEHKLELVGLKEVIDHQPSELSGGMAKRVGLARALVLEPELILFDEPSVGLDPVNSELINELIINLKEKHQVTSIVVTHEMQSAFSVATRMAMLSEGKIVEEGAPDQFRNSQNPVVSKFLSYYLKHSNGTSRTTSHANS